MKYLNNYNNFRLNKQLIFENKKQALNILRKNNISKNNKDFLQLIDILQDKFKGLNYLGQLTNYRFIQNVSLDEINDLIRWLDENNGSKLLKKPFMQYRSFEELKDEIVNIDLLRKVKLVTRELPREQKSYYDDATQQERDLFDGWSVKMFDIKYKKPFFDKISAQHSMQALLDYIEGFVRQNTNIKTFQEKIQEIQETDGADIYKVDEEIGIIAARIENFNASKRLGSSQWCISTGIGSWSNYVYDKQAHQYFVWNYSKSLADPLHFIGVTVTVGTKISDIHDVNDKSLSGNIPDFIQELDLQGMSEEEYLKRIETIRNSNRERSREMYENEPELVIKAEALQQLLEQEKKWIEAYDIYDIVPQSYDYYGLTSFEIELTDGSEEYAVGTDEEADSATYQYNESLWDDIGPEGFREGYLEYFIDSESLADYLMQDEWGYLTELVEEDPDGYGVERNMSDSDKEELDQLYYEREKLQNKTYLSEEEQEDMKEIEDRIEELEDEDNWEFSESSMEEKVEELFNDKKQEIIDEPIEFLNNMGYSEKQIKNLIEDFLDKDRLFTNLIETNGRGDQLSGYDGIENEIYHQGKSYFIYRTN